MGGRAVQQQQHFKSWVMGAQGDVDVGKIIFSPKCTCLGQEQGSQSAAHRVW